MDYKAPEAGVTILASAVNASNSKEPWETPVDPKN